MARKNTLTEAPPYAVEQSLKRLGENLRTARLRRNITIEEAAEKIGSGRRAVAAAENGKPSTSAAVYMALLDLRPARADARRRRSGIRRGRPRLVHAPGTHPCPAKSKVLIMISNSLLKQA
jgi:DNA-binding XRE family transcriptional regulator